MHLDDVENESAPRVEQYLSTVKVVRVWLFSVAGRKGSLSREKA